MIAFQFLAALAALYLPRQTNKVPHCDQMGPHLPLGFLFIGEVWYCSSMHQGDVVEIFTISRSNMIWEGRTTTFNEEVKYQISELNIARIGAPLRQGTCWDSMFGKRPGGLSS